MNHQLAQPLSLSGWFAVLYGHVIFVVSHAVIPETHRSGHQTPATLDLMAGFALTMVLDTALG